MKHISERGIALIKQFEGFCAAPYVCPAGKLTIGYGHVILPDEAYRVSGISPEEAERILAQDVCFAEHAINRSVIAEITQNQFDALASFIYNVGSKAFENSTLLRLLNQGDFQGAAAQFPRWVYSAGKKLDGLVSRRASELKLFLADS